MPEFLIFGRLQRETILLPDGKAIVDQPGGGLLYAAAGLSIWEKDLGLVSRIGEDFPRAWLDDLVARGWDVRGITVLPRPLDVRAFTAYADGFQAVYNDPIGHFARAGLPFPRVLLGYEDRSHQLDSRNRLTDYTIRLGDVPSAYLEARAAHLCPLDYVTHIMLPAGLRQEGCATVTLDPGQGYMQPAFFDQIPALLAGLTALLPSEEELSALFHGRTTDLWAMIEELGRYGCEIIVVKKGAGGQWVYETASHKRWEVPAYPNVIRDPTGAGDAFCGGFLAGYLSTFDPVEAALWGNISASLTVEGSGPFYALDALPGLAQARLEKLRRAVRKV